MLERQQQLLAKHPTGTRMASISKHPNIDVRGEKCLFKGAQLPKNFRLNSAEGLLGSLCRVQHVGKVALLQ